MQTKKNMWMDLLHLCTKIEKHNTQASEIFYQAETFGSYTTLSFSLLTFFSATLFFLSLIFCHFFLSFSKAQQPNMKTTMKLNLVQI